jgi:putative membrane protein
LSIMITFILVKYLHFIGIIGLSGTLLAENIMLKSEMSKTQLTKMSLIDAGYGISAMIAVTGGLILWFGVGKESVYYSSNWIFLVKVGIVSMMGIISIWPTVYFIKNRSKNGEDDVVLLPVYIRIMVRVQLIFLFSVPLLASLMAYGFGA